MATLPLKQSARTATFRKIVSILRTDPVMKRVFGDRIYAWDGAPDEAADQVAGEAQPSMRLTPSLGAMTWWSPDTQKGDLIIAVELMIAGLDVDDLLNLWEAIETALYPADNTARNKQIYSLQQVSAGQTGLCTFTMPANAQNPQSRGDENWFAIGQITIPVNRLLNA